MRIAIVTETFLPYVDGVVTRMTAVIRRLREDGHEILIIAPEDGIQTFCGCPVSGISARTFFLYRHRKVAFPHPDVKRRLTEFQPDVVHVVNPALLGIAGIFYGRHWPLVASWHTNIPQYADYYRVPYLKPLLWSILKKIHNRADLNLCTSNTVQEELKRRGFKNVQLWKRGVDLQRFHPRNANESMRRRLSDNHPDSILMLYVGRLAAEKEIERLQAILRSDDRFRLAVVGDGPHRFKLEQQLRHTPTVFTGFLHGEELAQAYASVDAFVFPSRTETLGLVLLEAMASGLPVIAVNAGPTAEQIDHEKTGLLYSPDHPEDLKNMAQRLTDSNLRRQIGVEARKAAHAYGWSSSAQQLHHYYADLLKKQTFSKEKNVQFS